MFAAFYGVDFSGARLAGLNTWNARIEAANRATRGKASCTFEGAVETANKRCGARNEL